MYLRGYGNRELLEKWKRDAFGDDAEKALFAYTCEEDVEGEGHLTIFTDCPGWVIGGRGMLWKKYTELLKTSGVVKDVEIKEVVHVQAAKKEDGRGS